jgi:hypothetical protein
MDVGNKVTGTELHFSALQCRKIVSITSIATIR